MTPESVYDEMMNTKIRFGKQMEYRVFISSSPLLGEVTPEQAHSIGLEFCKRLWATALKL